MKLMLSIPRSDNRLIICALLVVLVALVYAQVGWHDRSTFDDGDYVFANQHVRTGLSWRNINWALSTSYSANWHPVTWVSHMVDCQLFGLNPGAHHLVSAGIHALNAVLLFLLLAAMTGSPWRSGFVAALFAVHPLNVESVAWIAERKNVLSTLFWILTIWAYAGYVRRPAAWRYVLVAAVFALGLMAKPMLVTLPIILLLLHWWPRYLSSMSGRMAGTPAPSPRRALRCPLPALFALAAASCVVTIVAQHASGATRSLEQFPLGVRVANAAAAAVGYLLKAIWPSGLSALYPHPGASLPEWYVAVCAAVLAALTLLALAVRRSLPYVTVGWLWYVVTLIPVIGLVQVGDQSMADRYTYVPLIGVFLIVAWGVPDLLARFHIGLPLGRRAAAGLAVLVVVALAFSAWMQAGYWRDGVTLYRHSLKATGGSYAVRCCLATALMDAGRDDEAAAQFREAIRLGTDRGKAHNGLGRVLAKQGKLDQAVVEYTRALRANPRLAEAHNNLAVALFRLRHVTEARRHLEEALRIEPDYVDAHHNLGVVLSESGDTVGAISHWRRAVALSPGRVQTLMRLGMALLQERRAEQARDCLQRAVWLEPDSGEPHYRLAIALAFTGDPAGAWRELAVARRHGYRPDPSFTRELSKVMPEPR